MGFAVWWLLHTGNTLNINARRKSNDVIYIQPKIIRKLIKYHVLSARKIE